MKTRVLILITSIIMSQMGFASSAHASQCITGTPLEDSFKTYDYIFSGKVISIDTLKHDTTLKEPFPVDENGEPIEHDLSLSLTPTNVTLLVFYSWKGNMTDQITVKPFVSMEPLGFQFVEGESYLVFAENIEWSDYPVVTGCSDTKPLFQAQNTIIQLEQLVYPNHQSEFLEPNCPSGTVLKNKVCVVVNPNVSPFNQRDCLIATASFGSEMAPQVQMLREIRDDVVLKTYSGGLFMNGFNTIYYSFSPVIAEFENENPIFKEIVKTFITPMISVLSIMTLAEEGSEFHVILYGVSTLGLIVGMYIVAPVIAVNYAWRKRT